MKAALAAAAVPLLGAVTQRIGERRTRARYPAPGRFVDVAGACLHVVVEGEGPTVVIESGLGGSSIEWSAVASDLRRDCTVIRYDRPGLGWSPPARGDRSPRAVAERLCGLVTALGVELPAVFVGHSLGGLYVRLAASLRPEVVAGLVLVDPSDEDMLDDAQARKAADLSATVAHLVALSAPFGTAQVLGPMYARTIAGQVRRPPDDPSAMAMSTRLTAARVGGIQAIAAELTSLSAGLDQVRELTARHPVRPIPLTVITAAAPGRTDAERAAREKVAVLHERQAAASPVGRLVKAEHSGHLVPIDEPDLVARCIRDTIAATAPA